MSEIQKCPKLLRGGGGQHFSNMSEIQKCPNLVRGGSEFFKMSEIQKCPKGRRGTNWDIVPNFLDFLS